MEPNVEKPALRVYLVDDDPDHTVIIKRALRDVGHPTQVESIDNGATALVALRSASVVPDLILLDINMPEVSGFDVLTHVKADAGLKRIPVIMLTSSALEADIARAYELGASGYITKSTYLHDLRAVLGNTLLYWAAMERASIPGRS